MGDDDDTITNSATGSIQGPIDFGNGIDTLSNLGNIDGNIDMGGGDDTVTFDSAASVAYTGIVDCGPGTDTLTATNAILTASVNCEVQNSLSDTTPPTITDITSSTANATKKIGDTVSIQIVFDEIVDVTGFPILTLETGTTDTVATYTSGTGTDTLTFTYTVVAGDTTSDLDYISGAALALAGGTIQDPSANSATLTLPAPGTAGSLGANKALVIDGIVPTVTSVSATTINGTYGIGGSVDVTVIFSEAVTVTGTPTLTLETGGTDAVVSYVTGTGTNTLTFTYTVAG